jgi:hypothetical protein
MRMRYFWGGLLIVLGLLLLLQNLGILKIDLWGMFWALALIALGLYLVWGTLSARGRTAEAEPGHVSLDGARIAHVRIEHGAGRMDIHAGAASGDLLTGTFGGGLDARVQRSGDVLQARLRPRDAFNWPGVVGPGHYSLDWSLGLAPEVPLALDLQTGASDNQIDLTRLRVTDLRVDCGASSTRVRLPSGSGHTRVDLHYGAASIELQVPEGVAARIRMRGALMGVDVDQRRFPRNGDEYQSPDFASATDRVEIDAEGGVGSIKVS